MYFVLEVEESKEMENLISKVKKARFEHVVRKHWTGTKHLLVGVNNKRIASAISYSGRYDNGLKVRSYGGDDGLIEILIGNHKSGNEREFGWLNADEAFRIIERSVKREKRKIRYNNRMRRRNAKNERM